MDTTINLSQLPADSVWRCWFCGAKTVDPKTAAKEQAPRNMRQLLGEAINDVCAKYKVPQPYSEEALLHDH
jgi:hypothetical protein